MTSLRTWGTLLLALILLLAGCRDGALSGVSSQQAAQLAEVDEQTPEGLNFRLAEGSPNQGEEQEVPQAAQLRPLSESQLTALLQRLPDFKAKPLTSDFALREKSLPPPRAGETVLSAWPPPPADSQPDKEDPVGELEVVRHAPEGDVPMAPQLSVTFNQPMVAVTSHRELSKLNPPVRLTPAPPGQWRWIGTRTVLFDPRGEVGEQSDQQGRFPMATEYQVEVPAGTRSASGKSLSEAVRWSFRTPTVTLTSSSPNGGPQDLDPLMWAVFDQEIDPAAVLKTIKLQGGTPVDLRPASKEELVGSGLDLQPGKRWVAFKATQKLLPATSYTVRIGPDTPSAEGPLRSKEPQSFSFSTYDKFAVIRHSGSREAPPPPLSPLYIEFNNPIDVETFDPAMVKITPEVPGLKVNAAGRGISLQGQTRGRTAYKVRLDSTLTDSFGQRLGESPELTFQIGSAQPGLHAPGGMLVTTDPNRPTVLPVYVMNQSQLKVRIHAVEPEHWKEFQNRLARETEKNPFVAPGQEVVTTTLETGAETDQLTEVLIDLKPALRKGKGMVVVDVQTPRRITNWWDRERVVKWVQVSDVGIDAAVDHQVMQLMTTELKSGRVLGGVKLRLVDEKLRTLAEGVSQGDGSLTLTLAEQSSGLLIAENGDDVSILPEQTSYYSHGSWGRSPRQDQLRWFVVDDRQIYRPSETVRCKGWVRRWQAGPKGDLVGLQGELSELDWTLHDAVGNQVLQGRAPVTADGTFHFDLTLPKTMNLGHARLGLSASSALANHSYTHSFQVQEFRRPEFEVAARVSSEACVVGEHATATVEASYYAGGGLPGAPVSWSVSSSPGSYSPPGHDDFSFGAWTPWWDWVDYDHQVGRSGPGSRSQEFQSLSSRTDASGRHHLQLDFLSVHPPRPTVVRAEAAVSDVNRQTWNASTSVLVHPSDYYVGLRAPRAFVEKGDPLEIELVACHRDGKLLSDVPVEIAMWRQDTRWEKGRLVETKEELQARTIVSAGGPSRLSFKTSNGGTYRVKARVLDSQGRPNESSLIVWVSGAPQIATENLQQQTLTLVPSQKEYRAGEVAEILLQSPFAPAEGQVTWRRSGILKSERISLKESSTILKVPIEEGHVPNLQVQVDLVGATGSGPSQRPTYASGQLTLSVPPLQRALAVEIQPLHPATDPGAKTSIAVEVKTPTGQPAANAEVALFAVDEAVLALTGYQFPNPLDVLYTARGADTRDVHSRQYVITTRLEEAVKEGESNLQMADTRAGGLVVQDAMPAPSMVAQTKGRSASAPAARARKMEAADAAGVGQAQPDGPPIRMRTDFNPTALFAPTVRTDAQGRAEVPFKLPDNLTRYRLVALATDGNQQFGKGESALLARLPLMVRPSAPRFLNFGDSFELPVVLQNQTDQEMDVMVGARAVNLQFSGARGYSLKIPANDRVEVRFPATTTQAGQVNLQVGAVGPGAAADAAEVSLPVWTPATSEAFATYGEVDQGAIAQPVKPPADVWPQFGGLEITTTSTALQSLTDAFLYLTTYPFDCAEQVSSRLLAIAALRDVLWAFEAEGVPSAAELKQQVQRDMDRLAMLQQDNGGFGFWPTSTETWPYISVHVAHALARAKQKGYSVPEEMLAQSLSYLRQVEQYIPPWYDQDCQRVIRAYALYVRHQLGEADASKLDSLISEAGGITKLPLEGLGFVYSVIAKDPDRVGLRAEVRRHLNNSITETAGLAHFTTGYREEAGYVILASARRVDGILLEAMIKDQPGNDLIPKLARGLLAGRKQGRWSNTQDNCFVLLALDLYFQTYEKVTPDFVARAWLGDGLVSEQSFRGRQTDYQRARVPMSYLQGKGQQTLTLAKEGQGRLYYRLGLDYAPKDLKLDPADHGFAVERVYQSVDHPDDVRQQADGSWQVKAGARVRVKLTMIAPARRHHVALVDPLPAGLESINPGLAVSGTVPNDPAAQASRGRWWYWMGTWYEHQNMRDERVEAFTSLLWEGVHNYSYLARATTPGSYVVPPCRAEEMYAPETFGRCGTDRVVVVEKM